MSLMKTVYKFFIVITELHKKFSLIPLFLFSFIFLLNQTKVMGSELDDVKKMLKEETRKIKVLRINWPTGGKPGFLPICFSV